MVHNYAVSCTPLCINMQRLTLIGKTFQSV
nr:MAG TPA: nonstructural protein [Caudoviricetes sp.]